MATAVLTSKGQVTIPLLVRKKLGLGAGDRIEFVDLGEGKMGIVAATVEVASLKGIVVKRGAAVSVAAMNRAIARRGAGK